MNIGVDIEVCAKVKCKQWTSSQCIMPKNTPELDMTGDCKGRPSGCPVPKKCPYKALHIARGKTLESCCDSMGRHI